MEENILESYENDVDKRKEHLNLFYMGVISGSNITEHHIKTIVPVLKQYKKDLDNLEENVECMLSNLEKAEIVNKEDSEIINSILNYKDPSITELLKYISKCNSVIMKSSEDKLESINLDTDILTEN